MNCFRDTNESTCRKSIRVIVKIRWFTISTPVYLANVVDTPRPSKSKEMFERKKRKKKKERKKEGEGGRPEDAWKIKFCLWRQFDIFVLFEDALTGTNRAFWRKVIGLEVKRSRRSGKKHRWTKRGAWERNIKFNCIIKLQKTSAVIFHFVCR